MIMNTEDETNAFMDSIELMIMNKCTFNWDNFNGRMRVLKQLKCNKEFVDVMLITEDGGEDVVHSSVMSSLGNGFGHIIHESLQKLEKSHVTLDNGTIVNKVIIKGIERDVLNAIIEFAYNGSITCNEKDRIIMILDAANVYQIKGIITICCTLLIDHIDESNCVDLYNIGKKYEHQLSQSSWSFMKKNITNIIDKGIQLSLLPLSEIIGLIDCDNLNIKDEKIIWSVIKQWCNFDINSRINYLKELISYLRFGRIEYDFLTDTILSDSLIKSDDTSKRMIQKYIDEYHQLNRKDGYCVPIGLSKSVRPRVPCTTLFAVGGWQEGVPTTLIETYDVRTNRWFDSKIVHHYPRAYHGIEVINGIIYIIGGTNGTEILNTVQSFNPITKEWNVCANMYENRCYVSTVSIDGIIYAMGGHNGVERVKTCEKYDPILNQWEMIENMHISRSDASATVYNNRVYIAGGLNDQIIENTVEMYNPIDKTWTLIQPMVFPRTSLGFVNYNGSLYAIGGNNGFERMQSVERYDFVEQIWEPVADMRSRRSTFSACVLEDELYVIGGYNGHTPICVVEKYNDITKEWRDVKSIRHDRSGLEVCTVSELPNAKDYSYIGYANKNAENQNSGTFQLLNANVITVQTQTAGEIYEQLDNDDSDDDNE